MAQPLMPKAVAVWLIENTALTFDQIGAFCNLHPLEVQAIADGEVAVGIVGQNPVMSGELSAEEIARCEKTTTARLKMIKTDLPKPKARAKGPRYTPVAKRADKPDAIAWLLKKHPELTDSQICKLVGTTKPTIATLRERTHPNMSNLRPRSPVEIGLCSYDEMEKALRRAQRKAEREGKKIAAPEPDDVADTSFDATPAPAAEEKKEESPVAGWPPVLPPEEGEDNSADDDSSEGDNFNFGSHSG